MCFGRSFFFLWDDFFFFVRMCVYVLDFCDLSADVCFSVVVCVYVWACVRAQVCERVCVTQRSTAPVCEVIVTFDTLSARQTRGKSVYIKYSMCVCVWL